jgi:hypothetical protein
MPDLPEQISAYIDGIAEPVAESEVTEERLRATSRIRRRRVAGAVAAGAAIVLVPALLIAALGLFAGDDPVAAPSTSTAATTTTVPAETTTSVAVNLVEVPDVVGLTAVDATDLLAAAGFGVEATGDANDLALVSAQDPVPGSAVAPGATVRIEIAPHAPACREGWAPELPPLGPDEQEITVIFGCSDEIDPAGVPTTVIRRVPADADPIRATLDALLAGPTDAERAAGLHSFFSAQTAGALDSLAVDDGLAVVDFDDGIYVDGASTSGGSEIFVAELTSNLFQFDAIDRIEFRVHGRCEGFWGWMQRECRVATREGLVDELPFGSCSAAGSSHPPPDLAVDLPEPVRSTRALLLSLAVRCDLHGLDVLAQRDATSIVLSNLALGDTPFATLEADRQGAPAVTLVETLSHPHGAYEGDTGTEVYVWPDVAVPGFDWDTLTDAEIADLSARYEPGAITASIDGGVWAGFSVQVDETGRWRSFAVPLT